MQLKKPDFFVIGSGKLTTVRKFAEKSFKYFNLNYQDYAKDKQKITEPLKLAILKQILKSKKNFGCKPQTSLDQFVKL